MSRARKVLKWFGMALAAVVLLLGLAMAWAFFVPPKSENPKPRSVPDHSAFNLDEKVGWYQADDGVQWLVTWGADGDLTVADLAAVQNYYLLPKTVDQFTWVNHKTKEDYPVEFQRGEGGGISGFSWTLPGGVRKSAKRMENQGYGQSEVNFSSGGVELSGLLLKPLSEGPHPAVAFVHGSGVSDRDILWYVGVADFLAMSDVVVLLPDKRGCGKSGGQWHTSSFDDYAGDAVAAVEYLKGIDDVDPERIGLVGFSQGGFIVPLAAGKSGDVSFIVSFSGSACTIRETVRHEVACDMRDHGVPGWLASVLDPLIYRRITKALPEFWAINGAFDPIGSWKSLHVPALVLNGEKDENVPVAKSVARLEEVRRENPKAAITVKVFEGTGHGLNEPDARRVRQDCLRLIADWIHALPARPGSNPSP